MPKANDLVTLVAKYQTLSAPFANRIIGRITANITRTTNAAGESALGDVIADAQRSTRRRPAPARSSRS